MATKSTDQIIGMLEEQFTKLPPLPKNWRDVIVKIVPWIALVFGLLGVVGSIAALGALTIFAPVVALGSGIGAASNGFIGTIFAFVAGLLLLLAFPGLNKKKMSGWKLLFWSEGVSILSSIVAISIGGIVVGLIGFYLIFQIKSYYH